MSYTVTEQQITEIHNGLCHLRFARHHLEEVLAATQIEGIQKGISMIMNAFAPLREESDRRHNQKYEMYQAYGETHNFKSVWSVYSVESMDDLCDFNGSYLVYSGHWGEKGPVRIKLPQGKLTWGEMWAFADCAIRESGDEHHIFIERIVKKEDGNLYLHTGS